MRLLPQAPLLLPPPITAAAVLLLLLLLLQPDAEDRFMEAKKAYQQLLDDHERRGGGGGQARGGRASSSGSSGGGGAWGRGAAYGPGVGAQPRGRSQQARPPPEEQYSFEDLLRDLDSELSGYAAAAAAARRKRSGASAGGGNGTAGSAGGGPNSLWEELFDIGEEFVEFLEKVGGWWQSGRVSCFCSGQRGLRLECAWVLVSAAVCRAWACRMRRRQPMAT